MPLVLLAVETRRSDTSLASHLLCVLPDAPGHAVGRKKVLELKRMFGRLIAASATAGVTNVSIDTVIAANQGPTFGLQLHNGSWIGGPVVIQNSAGSGISAANGSALEANPISVTGSAQGGVNVSGGSSAFVGQLGVTGHFAMLKLLAWP